MHGNAQCYQALGSISAERTRVYNGDGSFRVGIHGNEDGGVEARLCIDLQGYTCNVKHRSGDKNLLADAVSRLFRVNDMPPVLTVDELRDDFGPLTEEEKI